MSDFCLLHVCSDAHRRNSKFVGLINMSQNFECHFAIPIEFRTSSSFHFTVACVLSFHKRFL